MSIEEANALLKIVTFDAEDGWHSVRVECPDYLDEPGQKRLECALHNKATCVAIEYHYIDKDYRDTFSCFHSKRFSTPSSRCVRLHFFSSLVTATALQDREAIQDSYLGYSVIRPTRPNCIGRTMIDVKVYAQLGAFLCTCRETVSLQGAELTVVGFPFISQDGDATVCAQSALWMVARYFSNRYALYPETYPFQLTQLVRDYSIGRIYPSGGLTMWQLAEAFRQLGFSPVIYSRATLPDEFDRLLYTYIESGIPVVAGMPGHAIAVVGHMLDLDACSATTHNCFSSEFCTGWVVSDDNHSPCSLLPMSIGGAAGYKGRDIDSFIAPLAEKIFLSAENFESGALQVLKDAKVGMAKLSPELSKVPIVMRLYLTTVRSYKRKLSLRGMGDPLVVQMYRQLPLPHFIWVCELSCAADYSRGDILGEIIWDATRNAWEPGGWIAIHYPEILLIDVGSALNGTQRIARFSLTTGRKAYSMHRSNLLEV